MEKVAQVPGSLESSVGESLHVSVTRQNRHEGCAGGFLRQLTVANQLIVRCDIPKREIEQYRFMSNGTVLCQTAQDAPKKHWDINCPKLARNAVRRLAVVGFTVCELRYLEVFLT